METGAVSLLCMDVQGWGYEQQLAETPSASGPLMRSAIVKSGSRLLMWSAIATLC